MSKAKAGDRKPCPECQRQVRLTMSAGRLVWPPHAARPSGQGKFCRMGVEPYVDSK